MTISELANMLTISTRAIEKQIAKLKKDDVLKRVGSRKHGTWLVSDEISE